MATAELDRLLAVKAALMQTTNTMGWTYIKQMSKNIVARSMQEAMAEKDRTAAGDKTFKAAALEQGFRDLFSAVETAQSFSTDGEEGWFDDLNAFQGEK